MILGNKIFWGPTFLGCQIFLVVKTFGGHQILGVNKFLGKQILWENSLLSAELEVNALKRRVQGLEEDLEKCEDKLLLATNKLDKAATAADDSHRMRKILENRAVEDEDRMGKLEEELKAAMNQAEDADKKK